MSHRPARWLLALVTCVCLSLARAVPADAAAPSLALRPNVGPPTSRVKVAGREFGPTEIVDIDFDSTHVARATTDLTGTISTTITIPSGASPGDHAVTAIGESSGRTAQAGFIVRTDWPRFHYDEANAGYNPYENVLGPANVSGLMQKWAVPTAPGAAPSPVVAGGLVFVAPADGVVRALNPATGATVWSYDTGGTMSGVSPDASGGVLYVGNQSGSLFALEARTGRLLWSADLGDDIFQAVTVANAAVFVTLASGNGGFIDAVDARTGRTVWSRGLLAEFSSPASGSGLVYTLSPYGGLIQAVRAQTGRIAWTLPEYGEVASTDSAALAGGMVVAGVDGYLFALDASTGHRRWVQQNTGGITNSTPAIAHDAVVYASSGTLAAYAESTGTLLWKSSIADVLGSSPAVANGVVYLGGDDSIVRAFDARTGATLWQSELDAAASASPAVADGQVYASSEDGTIYAFGLP